MDQIADKLLSDAGLNIVIEGHTDTVGDAVYNKTLSEKRALSVKKYLSEVKCIPPQQVTAVGFGESMPVAPNDSESNRAKNRRVEFRIQQASTTTEAQRRIIQKINDWASRPKNQANITRVSSATWVEYQSKQHKKELEYMRNKSKETTGEESTLTDFFDQLIMIGN